ncbi:MAG: pilus assembly protein PilM [Candidatus Omnitrophica bacterium]|nr:pilus assembly protein PilM [Candidatus Omnitrophota bacterium]
MNNFKKDRICLGLDLGTSAIKFCKLKFSKEGVELSDFYLGPAPGPEALKQAAQRMDLRLANIAVSGPATIIRYVNFPKMSRDELKKALKFEAQKYIPFSLAEVNMDVVILKDNPQENKMLVAIVAVKKDFLAQRIKIFEAADFKINLIDIDSLALVNAFNFSYPRENSTRPKSFALLNVGATFSNLNILEDGTPSLLSRDINIAGNNFTHKIADSFAIDFKAAEELKINPEKEKIQKIIQAGETVLSGLAGEIRVSFDYYESQSASSVGKIFLSGAGGLFPGFKDALANLLGIEVEYWEPLKQIRISSSLDAEKIKSSSSQLAIALGLALRP